MKLKHYLLAFSALALSATSLESSAQVSILNGKILLSEDNELVQSVETHANPYPFILDEGDFEMELALNANPLTKSGLSDIQAGELKWRPLKDLSTIPEDWVPYQFCDNYICYTYGLGAVFWFDSEDYFEFNALTSDQPESDFYTTMYIPESSEDDFGEIVIELVFDNGTEYYVDTFKFGFINLGPVNINELEELNTFNVYPNPVTDDLYIKMTEQINIQSVSLFSITGRQLIHADQINHKEFTLNVSSLNAGIYLVRIEDVNGKAVIKKINVQ